ncbi:MAG: M48 family metallopeptidase [Candidatus Omnitrophica bacterium]|nr:M48 family metallopeptidase [Candidatus Omnitrophota bacterium]
MPPEIARIVRTHRRTLGLQIMPDASLVVHAPERISVGDIERLILQKERWIIEKQRLARNMFGPPVRKAFTDGEEFLYLGERYPLRIRDEGYGPLIFTGNEFHLPRRSLPQARERFVAWYRRRALKVFEDRLALYGEPSGLKPRVLKVSHAKKRWGSCNSLGTINVSWRLVMAPIHVVDSIAVHELAHLAEQNHSKRFWDKVRAIFPGYDQATDWLRKNQYQLEI